VVAFIAAFPLLWWNEGRAVRTYQSLQEGAGAVVSVAADRVDPGKEGKLVHLSGRATTTEVLADPTFKVSANALRLRRQVEMYQWVEDKQTEKRKKLGGSEETITRYTYQTAWRPRLVSSSSFQKPEGHRNPKTLKYESASWEAGVVTVGAFTLDAGLRGDIHGEETVPATEASLRALNPPPPAAASPPRARKGKRPARARPAAAVAPAGPLKLFGEQLYEGADPGSPKVGDLRITFTRVPPTQVSIIAQQRGQSFQPYRTTVGRSLEMLTAGTVTAAQMFTDAERANEIVTWIVRACGFLLMLFGAYGVVRPMAVMASVLPFAGSLVSFGLGLLAFALAAPLSLLTIALAWLFYRPLLAIGILAGVVGLVVLIVVLARQRKAARVIAPAAFAPIGLRSFSEQGRSPATMTTRRQGLKLQVVAPCSEDWNKMSGGDDIRYCGKCRQNVYNLSEMTESQARDLVQGPACVRFFHRGDGTVITRKCPPMVQAARRRLLDFAARIVALLPLAALFWGSVAWLSELVTTQGRPAVMGAMELRRRLPRPRLPSRR
jgi:hypothetical protein